MIQYFVINDLIGRICMYYRTTFVYEGPYVFIYTHACTSVCVCEYACVHVCMHHEVMYVYACIYVCMYATICIYRQLGVFVCWAYV